MVKTITKWVIIILICYLVVPFVISLIVLLNAPYLMTHKTLLGMPTGIIFGISAIFIFLLPLLVLFGFLIWNAYYFGYARKKQLNKISNELGLSFAEGSLIAGEDKEGISQLVEGFNHFNNNFMSNFQNIMKGTWKGNPLCIFDYRYNDGRGVHNRLHYETIVYLELKGKNYKKIEKDLGNFTTETTGNKIIVYKEDEWVKPKKLKDYLDEILNVIKEI